MKLKYKIKIWLHYKLPNAYQDLCNGIKNLIYWFPIIWNDYDWDHSYLLKIEQHKLKSMLKYFIKSNLVKDNDIIIRDIKLCISLIDIILERGDWYINNGYINLHNKLRFVKLDEDCFYFNFPSELRIQKALFLYNKIKTEKLQTWWD